MDFVKSDYGSLITEDSPHSGTASFSLVPVGLFSPTSASVSVADQFLVEKNPRICAGAPVIKGTRISVHHLIALDKLGWGAEQILEAYPHLSAQHVEAAKAYYRLHKTEIESLIELDEAEGS